MTWHATNPKERASLRLDADTVRAKCLCGCSKFALILSPTPPTDAVPKTQWQLVCLNCKRRHV